MLGINENQLPLTNLTLIIVLDVAGPFEVLLTRLNEERDRKIIAIQYYWSRNMDQVSAIGGLRLLRM
jgi:hypothetical protein